MNPNQENIDRLWKLQEASAITVQGIADQMAAIPQSGIVVSQERWDQLFRNWEQAQRTMQEIGDALMKAHGLAAS